MQSEGEELLEEMNRDLINISPIIYANNTERLKRLHDVFVGHDMSISQQPLQRTFQTLEKLLIKETRLWWDVATLEKYMELKILPRGLRIKKFPTFPVEDENFTLQWNETLSNCSFKLIDMLIDYKKAQLFEVKKEVSEQQDKIEQSKGVEGFAKFEALLKIKLKKEEDETVNIISRKFSRDKMDYEVGKVYVKTPMRSRFNQRSFRRSTPKSILKPPLSPKKVSFSSFENNSLSGEHFSNAIGICGYVEADFLIKACNRRDQFLKRGYRMQELERAFKIAISKDREDLLKTKNSNRHQKIDKPLFITSYSRQFTQIKQIINKHIPMLYNDSKLREVLIKGYNFIHKSKTFVSTRTQKEYNINCFINCNTSYVVYLLTCTHCGIQYVGCTTRPLKNRMREHISQIGAKSSATTVSRHFSQCNQGNVSHLQIQVIDKVRNWSRGGNKQKKLLELEVRWIFILDTREPKGLNIRWDVSCHT
ncbi:hypothetical protein XELAEV_18009716mg [Xenopus laevis]|uniref:GIY-YIG domain-containing protein n=1 Tax=Xenopus laevis TaxID=8355 RepID=A0A974I0U4_XENLA|nr:hypothetical protein XELAEV_18009716mg [Xenopus laevis]